MVWLITGVVALSLVTMAIAAWSLQSLRAKAPNGRQAEYVSYIDGLRFIAVSLVVIYHAGLGLFPGGFVGVDVFFVISGYLMINILVTREYGFAKLIDFYNSRIRRIFPAYAVAALAVAVLSYFALLPSHLQSLGYALLSLPLFLSNFVFYDQVNYFAPDIGQLPLVHTWSLGVEWQFYLVIPIVLILSRRYRLPYAVTLSFLGAASLAWNIASVHRFTAADFYLLPGRLWEFVMGGLLVIGILPQIRSRLWAEMLALAGLGLLFFAAFHLTRYSTFPGINALFPCVGTACLLYAGQTQQTITTRLLSWSPLRLVGQSSYSIYLWHWIVISFVKYAFPENSDGRSGLTTTLILLASLLLGLLSWKFIELPCRAMSFAPRSARPLILAGLISLPTAALGILFFVTNGLPTRLPPELRPIAATIADTGDFHACLDKTKADILAQQFCRLGTGEPVKVLLLGDSHAAALAEGIDFQAKKAEIGGIYIGTSACAPMFNQIGLFLPKRLWCRDLQQMVPDLVTTLRPDTIIFHANWAAYYIQDAGQFARNLDDTFAWFARQPAKIFIVDDVPGARENVPLSMIRHAMMGTTSDLDYSYDNYLTDAAPVNAILAAEARKFGFTFIDLGGRICQGGNCPASIGNLPLYFDNSHLSGFGARYVSQYLTEIFSPGSLSTVTK